MPVTAEAYARRNVRRRAVAEVEQQAKAGAALCPCGCEKPAQISKHGTPGFRKGHRTMVTKTCQAPGCGVSFTFPWRKDRIDGKFCKKHAPLDRWQKAGKARPRDENGKLVLPQCACGEGEPHTTGDYYSKYKMGHAPNHRNAGKIMGSGTKEWREKIIPKMQRYRAGLTLPGAAPKVAAVLRNRGVTIKDLAQAFGLAPRTARGVLFPSPGRENMLRSHAERYLRYAAGLPYEPSNRQKLQATREVWSARRSKERQGKSNKTPSIVKPGLQKDLDATKHLTRPKEKWFK